MAAGLEAGLDVHLLARSSSSLPSSSGFRALVKGESGEAIVALPVSSVSKSDDLDGICEEVRDIVSHAPELLVTTSATTKGLAKLHDFLLSLADVRAQSGRAETTIFIPCENDPGADYPTLRSQLEAREVECRDTLVNRLCPEIRVDEATSTQEVVVDEFAEWVIEGEPDSQDALRALEQLPYVDFVEDVKPYETRKRWLVNGAHLALAILAHAGRIPTIDAAASEPGRSEWLERLHAALIQSLEQRYPGMPENKRYAAEHVASWLRHRDEVTRIMKRLQRANPLPFFDDIERKLFEPITGLAEPLSFEPVRYVLDRLHYVLQHARYYMDYKDLPSVLPTLDMSVDVRMATRYRELLVPVFGEKEAEKRAESLGVALEAHRKKHR